MTLKSSDMQVQAARLEDFLAGALLPLIGGHAFLVAILRLYVLHPEDRALCGAVALLVGLALFVGVLARGGRAGVLLSVGATSMLIALLLWLPILPAILTIIVATAAYASALATNRIGGAGSSLFLLHVPVVSHVLLDVQPLAGTALVTTCLLVSAAILVAGAQYKFGASALAGGFVAALVGNDSVDHAPVFLTVLVALLCVAALVYEWRLDRKRQSSLRRVTGQGLGAMLLLLLAALLSDGGTATFGVWFVFVCAFQGFAAARTDGGDVIRLTWPAIALVLALWGTEGIGDWAFRTAATCMVAAVLHLVALRARNLFLYAISVMLLSGPIAVTMWRATPGVFDPQLVILGGLVASLLIGAGSVRTTWRRDYPWWRGFISKPHWQTIERLRSAATAGLDGVAFVGVALRAVRTAWGWLGYVKGGGRVTLRDAIFVGGHLYGVWLLSGQFAAFAAVSGWPASALIGQVAWVCWGLALIVIGEIRDDLLARYTGLAFVCAQAVRNVTFDDEAQDALKLALFAATGAALAAYGAARLWRDSAAAHVVKDSRRALKRGGEAADHTAISST